MRILADAGGACTGIAHIDKMLVMEASNVPTGWMSSSYLTNHYDRDACDINFLSVCDIPGETEAEAKMLVELDDDTAYLRYAKRTRNDPCKFIWELNACEAYTEFETGGAPCVPGNTDITGLIDDSDKTGDVSSPCACRITVDFAATQNMFHRCYWDITNNLANHYGQFVLWVVAKVTGLADIIKMEIRIEDETNIIHGQNEITIDRTLWGVFDGFEVFSFRIGTSDNALLGVGNNWRIILRASNSNPTPIDSLHIACAYLVPVDEALPLVGGGIGIFVGGASSIILKNMDGDKGFFVYGSTSDTRYPNIGAVGEYPSLTPEVENWLYFVTQGWVLDDTFRISLKYRPRGIFLRGTNP